MEIVGATMVYDPPITAGRRVPKNDWQRVFIPATNSSVWITRAFSSWVAMQRNAGTVHQFWHASSSQKYSSNSLDLLWHSSNAHVNKWNQPRFRYWNTFQVILGETHISTSHLGNKSTGNNHWCAQHHNVVLESKYDGLSCRKREIQSFKPINIVRTRCENHQSEVTTNYNQPTQANLGGRHRHRHHQCCKSIRLREHKCHKVQWMISSSAIKIKRQRWPWWYRERIREEEIKRRTPWRWAGDAVGHAGQLVLHLVRLQLLLLRRRRRPSSGHPPPPPRTQQKWDKQRQKRKEMQEPRTGSPRTRTVQWKHKAQRDFREQQTKAATDSLRAKRSKNKGGWKERETATAAASCFLLLLLPVRSGVKQQQCNAMQCNTLAASSYYLGRRNLQCFELFLPLLCFPSFLSLPAMLFFSGHGIGVSPLRHRLREKRALRSSSQDVIFFPPP